MGAIFYFSAQTGTDSREQSGTLLEFFNRIFGDNVFTDFIIRKGAHTLEFAGLCFLLSFAWYFTKGKAKPVLSLGLTSIYAVTDEIHQLFVDGRACKIIDWVIDTCGAIIGLAAFGIILAAALKIINKKKKSIDTAPERD